MNAVLALALGFLTPTRRPTDEKLTVYRYSLDASGDYHEELVK